MVTTGKCLICGKECLTSICLECSGKEDDNDNDYQFHLGDEEDWCVKK